MFCSLLPLTRQTQMFAQALRVAYFGLGVQLLQLVLLVVYAASLDTESARNALLIGLLIFVSVFTLLHCVNAVWYWRKHREATTAAPVAVTPPAESDLEADL